MLSKEQISKWLVVPGSLPSKPEIDTAVRNWPWFEPIRLMEIAMLQLEDKNSLEARNLHYLYCPNAVTFAKISQPTPKTTAVADPNMLQEKFGAVPGNETEKTLLIHPENPIQNFARDKVDQFLAEVSSEDFFLNQGIELPVAEKFETKKAEEFVAEYPKTLMVMMSFADWLAHFKHKSQKEEEEAREKSALRSMWQQERLAAALQEETEEIPEQVFTMAVNSITREDDIISEPLARILEQQEKWDAASEMYQKLGLKNPSKSTYFASRAEAAKKRQQQ